MPKATIRLAIQNRRRFELLYPSGSRVVEPYVYGANRGGKELLRAFQTDGSSRHSRARGWKLFLVDEIGAVALLKEPFEPRADYVRGDHAIERIFAQI